MAFSFFLFQRRLFPFSSSGLGPRKFRTRDLETGDRSGWTDTPADKLRKAQVRIVHFCMITCLCEYSEVVLQTATVNVETFLVGLQLWRTLFLHMKLPWTVAVNSVKTFLHMRQGFR